MIDYWNTKIHDEIPATQLLGIEISELGTHSIIATAPLKQNINGHKTGFAGSIYTLGITAGWTLVSSYLKHHSVIATVVAGNADIKYRLPLKGDLIAKASFEEESVLNNWQQQWQLRSSARQKLTIDIGDGSVAAAQINATFYIKKV